MDRQPCWSSVICLPQKANQQRGGAHTARRQDSHCEEAFHQARVFCGQSQTCESFNTYIISFIFSITFFYSVNTCLILYLPLIKCCCWLLCKSVSFRLIACFKSATQLKLRTLFGRAVSRARLQLGKPAALILKLYMLSKIYFTSKPLITG